jgi:hypothetical protein
LFEQEVESKRNTFEVSSELESMEASEPNPNKGKVEDQGTQIIDYTHGEIPLEYLTWKINTLL